MRVLRPGRFAGFLLASAALIGTVAVTAGLLAGEGFERQVLRHEEAHTAAGVQTQARQHLTPADFTLARSTDRREAFESFIRELPEVFRLKVFDRAGRIVWSDESKLIGMAFPDNPNLAGALGGRIVTVLEETRRSEHLYEQSVRHVAEVYVPIRAPDGSGIMGVIETYKDATKIVGDIQQMRRRVWTMTVGMGTLLFGTLAMVVWQALRGERKALRLLGAQNRELTVLHGFAHSLVELEGGQVVAADPGPRPMASTPGHPPDPTRFAQIALERIGRGLDLRGIAFCRVREDATLDTVGAWAGPGTAQPAPPAPDVVRRAIQSQRPVQGGATVAMVVDVRQDAGWLGGERAGPPWDGEAPPSPRTTYLVHAAFPADGTPADRGPVAFEIMVREFGIALANVKLVSALREARERVEAILSAIADRMVVVDRQMRVVWMNGVAQAETSARIGLPCFEIFGEQGEVCQGCPTARSLQNGTVERGVRAQRLPDGQVKHLDLVSAPLRDARGEVVQALEVARDVTAQVEMEERLKQSSARLQESHAVLEIRAAELEQTNQALQEAQTQLVEKERLAAVGELVVSLHHEVLNPLTGILGALRVLRQAAVAPPDLADALTQAEGEVRRIEQLIRRLPRLREAVGSPYLRGTTMLDLSPTQAEQGEPGP